METIKYYDRKEGEIYTDDSQENVYVNVEEAKARNTCDGLMVWLQVELFYGKEYTIPESMNPSDFYKESEKYTEAEKDFDAFVINELGFKWLFLNDDLPPIEYGVRKIFSREEAEIIKNKINEKSQELGIEVYAYEHGFNQDCPRCHFLTDMLPMFRNYKCKYCGKRLPDKDPWCSSGSVFFEKPSIPERVKNWVSSLI